MRHFVDILRQFTPSQRLAVLVLLLAFTSGTLLVSQYLKTDDCRPLIEENKKMVRDFATISAILRKANVPVEDTPADSTMAFIVDSAAIPAPTDRSLVATDKDNPPQPTVAPSDDITRVLEISESYSGKQ